MPFGPYYAGLPTDAGVPPKRYVDSTSWDAVIDNFVNWKGNVNGGGFQLGNVAINTTLTMVAASFSAQSSFSDAFLEAKSTAIGSTAGFVKYQRSTTASPRTYWMGVGVNGGSEFALYDQSAPAFRMVVLSDGKIGLGGITGPLTQVHIGGLTAPSVGERGQLLISDANAVKRLAIGVDTSGAVMFSWLQSVENGLSTRPLFLNPNGGTVGIGSGVSTTSIYTLDVNGSIRLTSDFFFTKGGSPFIGTTDAFDLRFGIQSTEYFRIGVGGKIMMAALVGAGFNFASDAAAATGGIAVGGLYRNGNVINIRLV